MKVSSNSSRSSSESARTAGENRSWPGSGSPYEWPSTTTSHVLTHSLPESTPSSAAADSAAARKPPSSLERPGMLGGEEQDCGHGMTLPPPDERAAGTAPTAHILRKTWSIADTSI